ncbi:MAG: tetratricopeptide repeat protein [Helicobacteraceae bacterium]|jgi:tetratricopeptide (TPR) repeat protein|nr:tetratricopeptide repeat protein [Helicobacteraceae bacterium]
MSAVFNGAAMKNDIRKALAVGLLVLPIAAFCDPQAPADENAKETLNADRADEEIAAPQSPQTADRQPAVVPLAYKRAFDEALELFEQRDYEGAYERFAKLYAEDENVAPAAFYTGRAALETGRYEIAADAFRQTILLEPNHSRAKLELARTYFLTNRPQEAKALFEEVKSATPAPPLEVSRNIDLYLFAMEKRQKRSRFNGQIMANAGYDSNVNQGGDKTVTASIGTITFEIDMPKAESDTLLTLGSFNSHIYDFGEFGGFAWLTTFVGYANKYSDLSENDLLLIGAATGPTLSLENSRATLQIGYDRALIDSEKYIDMIAAEASYDRQITETGVARAHLKFYERSDERKGRENLIDDALLDLRGFEVGLDWHTTVSQSDMSFALGAAYGDQSSKKGHNANSELNYIAVNGSVSFSKNPWIFGVQARYKRSDYDNRFVIFENKKREDDLISAEAFANYSLASSLMLTTRVGYAKNLSSLDYYEHDKVTAQGGLVWFWGI